MRRPLSSLVAFVVFFALPVLAQIAENQNPEGRLTGTVLDQRGEPLTNIYIHAFREETRMYMPTAVTDKAGRFAVEELEAGTYDMFGESDAADYPDTSLSLYGKEKPTRIVLGYGERANVTLVLGLPAGILSGTRLCALARLDLPRL